MATLTSISNRMTCEISPLKFSKDSKWLETHLLLKTALIGQTIAYTPLRPVTLMYNDFVFFINGVRDFLKRLKERPEDSDPLQPFCPFVFTPLELDFEFSCLEGEYDEDGNGEVAIRFMVNLKQINDGLTSEYIGYTTEVEVKELHQFVDRLEIELSNSVLNKPIIHQRRRQNT